jgi:hypothetical protein
MAIEEIVSSLDAYIARLKEARDQIASLYTESEMNNRNPTKRKGRGKRQPGEVAVQPPAAPEIAVQIIPARGARKRRHPATPASPTFSPLGGPIPQGPVVIRSSDLARMRSASSQLSPSVQSQESTASLGALEELAHEVAQRLQSSGRFHH